MNVQQPSRREFCTAITGAAGLSAQASQRPNFILVLTDDQGYGDIAAHGNPIIKTPNLDHLHTQSVRFTEFHVSPTCSPTRTALMSGRHEFKSGVTHTVLERERMSPKSTTIAQVLKIAGYTTGIFGKWHLGDAEPYQPQQRGFDEVFIHGCGGIGHEYQRMYKGLNLDENTQKYFGMCTNIDDNVGKLLSRLNNWGIEKNTLLIFMTDNGGTGGVRVFNDGMRGAKGTPYRGGTRVPAFFRWPGTLQPGDRKNLAAHVDIFPTLAELAGASIPT